MLVAEYRFQGGTLRPTVVAGTASDVGLLAQATLEAGVPIDALDIRSVLVGGFVHTGLRQFLTNVFQGAMLVEKYSLSEIFGGATRTSTAPWFSLDPYVVGEVVDERGSAVEPGAVGELALTELFPFVQMQPLIRYRTGDIVMRLEDDESGLRFEWWGREDTCLRINGAWVMGYRSLADWLSQEELVARHSPRPNLRTLASGDVGDPCFTVGVNPEDGTILLEIGLRINPWWARDATTSFVHDLWFALRIMLRGYCAHTRLRLGLCHLLQATDDFSSLTGKHTIFLTPKWLLSDPPELPDLRHPVGTTED